MDYLIVLHLLTSFSLNIFNPIFFCLIVKNGNISLKASEKDGNFENFDLQRTPGLKVNPETSESSQYNILLDL